MRVCVCVLVIMQDILKHKRLCLESGLVVGPVEDCCNGRRKKERSVIIMYIHCTSTLTWPLTHLEKSASSSASSATIASIPHHAASSKFKG